MHAELVISLSSELREQTGKQILKLVKRGIDERTACRTICLRFQLPEAERTYVQLRRSYIRARHRMLRLMLETIEYHTQLRKSGWRSQYANAFRLAAQQQRVSQEDNPVLFAHLDYLVKRVIRARQARQMRSRVSA